MLATSRIEVDLPALSRNVNIIRRILSSAKQANAPTPGLCAVLKADGYGLGAPRIARRLALSHIDLIAVHRAEQARELVESAVMTPILVLMPVYSLERSDTLYRAATRGQLHFSVHDAQSLDGLIATADGHGIILPVHLELDTGMSRSGARVDDAGALLERINRHPRLKLAGVFNHLSSADDNASLTAKQNAAFTAWLDEHAGALPDDCVIHEANTMGLLRSSTHHRTMARVGLALLGYGATNMGKAEDFEFAQEAQALVPCMRWISRIVQMKWIPRGTPVGYGATWRAKRKTLLGLVPVGYADGYPLALSNEANVGVLLDDDTREYAPVVGRISMDQLVIDLTTISKKNIDVGCEVELVGNDPAAPNSLPTLAAQAGTIPHEMLCRLSPRLQRKYLTREVTPQVEVAIKPVQVSRPRLAV